MTERTKAIVRQLENVTAFPDACGQIQAITGAEDFAGLNFAVATMERPSEAHYHANGYEFYYVLSGVGQLVLGRRVINLKPNTLVMIPPMRSHFTIPFEELKLLVVSSPPWSAADQFLLKRSKKAVGYSVAAAKKALINAFLKKEIGDGKDDIRARSGTVLARRNIATSMLSLRNKSLASLRQLFND